MGFERNYLCWLRKPEILQSALMSFCVVKLKLPKCLNSKGSDSHHDLHWWCNHGAQIVTTYYHKSFFPDSKLVTAPRAHWPGCYPYFTRLCSAHHPLPCCSPLRQGSPSIVCETGHKHADNNIILPKQPWSNAVQCLQPLIHYVYIVSISNKYKEIENPAAINTQS